MKRIIYLALLLLVLASCVIQAPEDNQTPPVTPPKQEPQDELVFTDPVETRKANTDYKPDFNNQTRVAGVKTTTKLSIEIISDQLNRPWGMVELPSGELVITQKQGSVVLVNNENKLINVQATFPSINSSGQGGLLDVAVANDFTNSRVIYFTLSENTTQGTHTAVAKGIFNDDLTAINNIEVIYRALPSFKGDAHYGSRVVVDSNNNLFVSTGDRQSLQTRDNAQDLSTAHGKILHIAPNGKAVSTNPWVNDEEANPEVYALGLRNAQGLAIDPSTNTLYVSDMGPKGGDEINVIESSKNYGWPIIGYGIEYSNQPVGQGITKQEGLEQPLYYWDPSIAPSGIAFYDNDTIKEWKNNLFVGALAGKHLIRLVISDNQVIGEERLLEDINQRFRDVLVSSDGSLYAISDEGRLVHIKKAQD